MENETIIQKPADSDVQYEKVQRINIADTVAERDQIVMQIANVVQECEGTCLTAQAHRDIVVAPLQAKLNTLNTEIETAQDLGVVIPEVPPEDGEQ